LKSDSVAKLHAKLTQKQQHILTTFRCLLLNRLSLVDDEEVNGWTEEEVEDEIRELVKQDAP
jgi:translation elongation factor EF-Tu-like GTPase